MASSSQEATGSLLYSLRTTFTPFRLTAVQPKLPNVRPDPRMLPRKPRKSLIAEPLKGPIKDRCRKIGDGSTRKIGNGYRENEQTLVDGCARPRLLS